MSASLVTPPPIETMADLLEHLGDIGPERVCMRPLPGTATEDDVLAALESPRKRICELIDGVLVEKAMGYSESILAAYLIIQLNAFVRPRKLGLVTGEGGTLRLWPGRVRIPDVAFVAWDRFPDRRVPKQPIPTLAPDLAIEVLSVSNTPAEMSRKRQDYFAKGTHLVWEIDPRTRTASVYTAPEPPIAILTEADVLDGSPVLPGFTLALRDLFAELDQVG
ncbi:MAG TPA: Uma2 family endonuclease [Gemmataceae bacterium]|jgi:Uma2 family endonuclease|nr:Uma2 family endonuclease [Gemmataceae bacterium]